MKLQDRLAAAKRKHLREKAKRGEIKADEVRQRNAHAMRKALSLELARDQFRQR